MHLVDDDSTESLHRERLLQFVHEALALRQFLRSAVQQFHRRALVCHRWKKYSM